MTLREYTGFKAETMGGFIRKVWAKPDAVRLWSEYRKFREVYTHRDGAKSALYSARIVVKWRDYEWDGCDDDSERIVGECRLRAEADEEPYYAGDMEDGYTNIHGRRVSAEEAQKEISAMLERDGVWGIVAEVWNGKEWEMVDSIWSCAGYSDVLSPYENCYVVDHMAAAMDRADELLSEIEEFCQAM